MFGEFCKTRNVQITPAQEMFIDSVLVARMALHFNGLASGRTFTTKLLVDFLSEMEEDFMTVCCEEEALILTNSCLPDDYRKELEAKVANIRTKNLSMKTE